MRRLTLLAAFIALSACNRNEQPAETTGVDQAVTAEAIGGNDLTAIDAATNDSANMAADAELSLNAAAEGNAAGNEVAVNATGGGNEQ